MLSEHLSYKQKQINILAYEKILINVYYNDLRTWEYKQELLFIIDTYPRKPIKTLILLFPINERGGLRKLLIKDCSYGHIMLTF